MYSCPFCQIVRGEIEASVIYEDDFSMAVVPLHAPYPESAVVFPKQHIDHFTNLPDSLASQIMKTGFRIGQKIMSVYSPDRIGMGVHGYGVAHAHFNVFPQNHPFDVVFKKMIYVKEGQVSFGFKNLPVPSRTRMDEIAERLRD
ncbi:MAG: HIT family protein [Pseudomonadota bacterium]